MGRARIRIRRAAGGYVDRRRAYRVILDGTTTARIKHGESVTLETDAGHHELHLTLDWGRSPSLKLDLAPDKEVELRCRPNAHPLTALFWITFGRSRYIAIEMGSATPDTRTPADD